MEALSLLGVIALLIWDLKIMGEDVARAWLSGPGQQQQLDGMAEDEATVAIGFWRLDPSVHLK